MAYMKRQGWTQGGGLGANQQGITAPLIMKKTDGNAGQIAVGANLIKKFNPHTDVSKVVVLLNAVSREEALTDDALEEDMQGEAGKYGRTDGGLEEDMQGEAGTHGRYFSSTNRNSISYNRKKTKQYIIFKLIPLFHQKQNNPHQNQVP